MAIFFGPNEPQENPQPQVVGPGGLNIDPSTTRLDPAGYGQMLGQAIKNWFPSSDAPTFQGSSHNITPVGMVAEIKPEVDVHPDAVAGPVTDKKALKELEPFNDRLAKWVTGFGKDHMITPGTEEYYGMLGILSKQRGTPELRKYGPLQGILQAFSPSAQETKRIQNAADAVGSALLNARLQNMAEDMRLPGTLGEGMQAAPGQIRPTQNQMMGPGPLAAGYATEPVPNLQAPLEGYQKEVLGHSIKAQGQGSLLYNPETKTLEPKEILAYQGRMPSAEVIDWAAESAVAPLDQPLRPAPKGTPAVIANKVIEERGQKQRSIASQLSQGVRDVLAANGWSMTPQNVERARTILKDEADAKMQSEQLYKSGNDQQLALAQRLFHKFPHQLNAGEWETVKQEEAKRASLLASYEKAATIDTLNETQKLNEGSFFWLDEKGQPASPDFTRAEAARKGYKPVPPAAVEATGAARASKHILAEYKDVVKKVLVKATGNTAVDLGKVKLNQIVSWIKGNAGDPDVQALDALNSNLSTYSKALFDTGNVAVAEQMMRLAALPNWTSTQESAHAKLTSLERILDNVIKARGLPVNQDLNSYYKPAVKISGDADYDKLPKGARYIGPDGIEREK